MSEIKSSSEKENEPRLAFATKVQPNNPQPIQNQASESRLQRWNSAAIQAGNNLKDELQGEHWQKAADDWQNNVVKPIEKTTIGTLDALAEALQKVVNLFSRKNKKANQ